MGENRNMILAVVIAIAILLLYQVFVIDPMVEREQAREAARGSAEEVVEGVTGTEESFGEDAPRPDGDAPRPDAAPGDAPRAAGAALSREEALARSARVPVRTEALSGSIALTGGRFDDLQLLRYDTEPNSGVPVTLLNPAGSADGYFAVNGWAAAGDGAPQGLPGMNTPWRLVEGETLTPDTPVVLEHVAGPLTFRRTITVDEDYLFRIEDEVTNASPGAIALARYGLVRREGKPEDLANFYILHEGPLGVVGDSFFKRKYDKIADQGLVQERGEGGWAGVSDKYWLTAVAPDGAPNLRAEIRYREGSDVFEANYIRDPETIASGQTLTSTAYVYAGSKAQPVLSRYENELGIARLTMAIDWGMFWFLTRPFFFLLHTFTMWTGNFGLAIMLLTVLIKLALFPLNNRAFASMAKMRAVQPKMTEIRERFAADKERQQREMIELYRREKINPVAGCLPILPQIPIFFALYKTVFISLDARHEPFLWVRDMAAPDPTNMWNIFGLLPYDPSGWPVLGGILAIGAFPILMGITMWLQQGLNPPPPDPMQRRIFALLPIIFTIVLAPFAAALVIYWAWNNFLTILQQYVIMRRHGTETGVERLIAWVQEKRGRGSSSSSSSDEA